MSPDFTELNDGQLNGSSGALGPTFSTSSFCLARLPLVEPMSSASGQEGKRFVLCILQTDGSPEVGREPLPRLWGLKFHEVAPFWVFARGFRSFQVIGRPRNASMNASKRLEIPFCLPEEFLGRTGESREKGAFFQQVYSCKTSSKRVKIIQTGWKTSVLTLFDSCKTVALETPRNASKFFP